MTRPVVLHVCAVEYSARTILVPQMAFLADQGLDVRLACAPDDGEFGADLARFSPTRIDFSRHADPVRALRAAQQFATLVRRMQPELVHVHSSSAGLATRMVPRRFLGAHPPRFVFTVHGFPFLWSELDRARFRALELLERTLARRTDLMFFQSQEDFDNCVRRGYQSDLRFLGNGVQEQWFEPFPPIAAGERLRLLYAGRITRVKGILELLEAVARVPEVDLVVAGRRLESERDDISAAFDAAVRDPRLEGRVTVLGLVHPNDMPEVMGGADVFVLPTYHREGVPRSIIEAMAAGRPVITTPVRGARELVDDGVHGWVVQPRDVDALTSAIAKTVAFGRDRLREVGAAGHARAVAYHREADVLARLANAYRELIEWP